MGLHPYMVLHSCDAPTRWLDGTSRSRSGHRRGGVADTCTTRCRRLLSGSDTASSETRASGHLQLLGCAADTSDNVSAYAREDGSLFTPFSFNVTIIFYLIVLYYSNILFDFFFVTQIFYLIGMIFFSLFFRE